MGRLGAPHALASKGAALGVLRGSGATFLYLEMEDISTHKLGGLERPVEQDQNRRILLASGRGPVAFATNSSFLPSMRCRIETFCSTCHS